MSGRRLAVVVTVEHQDDPVLSRFAVPTGDVPVLSDALSDGGLGGFDVAFLHDAGSAEVRERITALFEGRDQDDLVLLYFRGIMLTGPGGGLYLAGSDTAMARPADTAVDVSQIAAMMQRSRAGQAVVLLDGRTGGPVDAGHHFRAARTAEWQSRVVIAATARPEPPTFAGMIADGIRNGGADRDRDGFVGIGELHDHLRERDPSVRQWVFGSGRQPYVSRIRRPGSDQMTMIAQLAVAAAGADLTRAVEARETLRRMATGEGRVAAAATAALRRTSVRLTEPALDFGRVPPGTRQLAAGVPVQGPPLTVASAVTSSVEGLHARLEGSVLKVSWFPTVGRLDGVVTVEGPAGVARLAVTGEVSEELESTGGFRPTPGVNGARPAAELPVGPAAGWQPALAAPAQAQAAPAAPVGPVGLPAQARPPIALPAGPVSAAPASAVPAAQVSASPSVPVSASPSAPVSASPSVPVSASPAGMDGQPPVAAQSGQQPFASAEPPPAFAPSGQPPAVAQPETPTSGAPAAPEAQPPTTLPGLRPASPTSGAPAAWGAQPTTPTSAPPAAPASAPPSAPTSAPPAAPTSAPPAPPTAPTSGAAEHPAPFIPSARPASPTSGAPIPEPRSASPVSGAPSSTGGWPNAAGGGFGWGGRPPQPRGPVPAASESGEPLGTPTADDPPAVAWTEAPVSGAPAPGAAPTSGIPANGGSSSAGTPEADQGTSANGGPVPGPRREQSLTGWPTPPTPETDEVRPTPAESPEPSTEAPETTGHADTQTTPEPPAAPTDHAPTGTESTAAEPEQEPEQDQEPAATPEPTGAQQDDSSTAGYQGWSAAGSWPTASVAGAAWLRPRPETTEPAQPTDPPEPTAPTPPAPAEQEAPTPPVPAEQEPAAASAGAPPPASAQPESPLPPPEEPTPTHPWPGPSHHGVAGDPWLTPPARTNSHPDADVTDPLPTRPAATNPQPHPWPAAAAAPTTGWPGGGPGSDDPWAGAGPRAGAPPTTSGQSHSAPQQQSATPTSATPQWPADVPTPTTPATPWPGTTPTSGAPTSPATPWPATTPTSGAPTPQPAPPADPWGTPGAATANVFPNAGTTPQPPADPWGQPTARVSTWPASPATPGWQSTPEWQASPAAPYPATVRGTAQPGSPPPAAPYHEEKPRRRAGKVLAILLAVAVLAAGSYLAVRLLRPGTTDNTATPTPQGQQEQSTPPETTGAPTEPPAAEIPVSLTTPVIVDRFKLGQEPEGVVVSPDNKVVYVADQNSKDVHFIEVATRKITKVSVPNTPRFIAISQDGSRVYASMFENDFTGNGLAVIDTKNAKLVKAIRTGPRPFEPAVGPDGDVWVPIHNGARVEIYDDESLTESSRISVPPNPHWVTFSPDGTVAYTANHESSQISVVNTADRIVRRNIKVGRSPHAIALTPDGKKLIVTNYDLDKVQIFDTTTLRQIKQISVGKEPQAVMTSTDGKHAYIVNEGSDTLSVIDLDGLKVVSTVKVGDSPRVVALSPDGLRLYVTDGRSRTVTVLRTTEE
ncbi:YVTN family beta-propeller protein [Actinoplanes lutulentus]|uniref:beta-propeller fold lactonase family protein n=1 Tax=Actinoplanes lutulentus TaxID=1287878 RepID=UPI0011B9370A|nr:beta-propeller fold lactonase family protein [Actinoplanes lutulentus]MBB2946838.1 YVTN family beta-propeller protein [Actinoplanes lutulentus]